jgi:hypothetical protein
MSEIAGLGLLIGNFIGSLLLIYFGSMLVGWLLKALVGETLSWARAEPGEEGYMKRMWVTHALPFFLAVLGSALPSLIAAGVLLFRKNKAHEAATARSSGSSTSQPTGATVQPSIPSQKGTTAPPTSGSQHDNSGEPPTKPGSLDTHLVVKITQAQAAQGCKIRLKTGGDEQVELPIPAGTTAGAHLRVAGGGIRKGDQIGDQWVRVNIEG